MANIANIALFIAVVICFASQTEAWLWPWFHPRPWFHPHPPMQPVSPVSPPPSHSGSPPQLSVPKLKKCLTDLHLEHKCMEDIMESFWSSDVTIEPDCCKVSGETKQDCANTVFARLQSPLQNPTLKNVLNDHCNKKSSTPSKA
ncbi:hypothetical protein RIF29_27613 [Crotalaria pallida]|uniref:Prolamin-like domain-containing protein n=1 Tax=Crotalaria pallida TaxID=3830 RepID=A0AAN9EQC3_CROPI